MTTDEMRIMRLWDHERLDTRDISRIMGIKEAEVYSVLWRIREERRHETWQPRRR